MSKSMTKSLPKPLEQVPKRLWIQSDDAGGIHLEAALPVEGDKPPLRRFSMTAYTGSAMQLIRLALSGRRRSLAGLRVPKKSRPILKDHDGGQIVGHTNEIGVTEQSLDVSGVVSGSGATAQEIIATSENGFPWQASLGATADKVVFITEGKKATANGREFTGPLYIARKSTLGEISFVALGADDNTWAHVAAGASGEQNQEVNTMEFEQWAADNKLPIDDMDEKHVASLKAVFVKQQATPPAKPTPRRGTGSRRRRSAPIRLPKCGLRPPPNRSESPRFARSATVIMRRSKLRPSKRDGTRPRPNWPYCVPGVRRLRRSTPRRPCQAARGAGSGRLPVGGFQRERSDAGVRRANDGSRSSDAQHRAAGTGRRVCSAGRF